MKTLHLLTIVAFLSVTFAASTAISRGQTTLTQDQIREVVRKGTPAISACYARHAMKQKEADGKVQLQLVIKPTGKVASVEVEAPSVRGKKFERCATSAARRWEFPEAVSETEVIYPMYFVHTHARGAGPR